MIFLGIRTGKWRGSIRASIRVDGIISPLLRAIDVQSTISVIQNARNIELSLFQDIDAFSLITMLAQ